MKLLYCWLQKNDAGAAATVNMHICIKRPEHDSAKTSTSMLHRHKHDDDEPRQAACKHAQLLEKGPAASYMGR